MLAKKGRFLGGNAVDGWVLEEACRLAGLPAPDADGDEASRFWRRLMIAEACRVKEAVHFDETAVFRVVPPGLGAKAAPPLTFTRAQLAALLESNGFYRGLEACLDAVLADARASADEVDDVLLVGGSTLLPGVFARIEARFGRRAGDAARRASALASVEALGEMGEPAVATLATALASTDGEVAVTAARALGRVGSVDAVPVLRRASSHWPPARPVSCP